MKAKELLGKEVIDVNAKVVGKIADMEIDVKKASILRILVKSGFLRKKISILPADVEKIGDKVMLKIAKAKVQRLTI
jgi:sporulation protein YlmC with PRC-barrel domain